MTEKELKNLSRQELITLLCQAQGTEAGATDLPDRTQPEEEKRRRLYRSRYRRTLISTVSILLVVAAISILITMLWMPVYRIYGSSMAPTLEDGQIVIAARGSNYGAGDLVAFYYGNKLLIKRVIAGPGDVVDVKENGNVYVNGNLLEETYVSEKALGDSDVEYPVRVTEDHWFLLGDNRPVSVDSRNAQLGCVSQEQIVGKVLIRVWPNMHQLSKETEKAAE